MVLTSEQPSRPAAKGAGTARLGAIMVFCMLLSRVLGMLRDSVMAYRFGIGLDTDAYRIAVQIPDLLFMLIAGGGLSSAFMPVFGDFYHKGKEKQAWQIFSVVVSVLSVVTVALIAIVWVLTPPIVRFFAVGHDPSVIPLAVEMSRIILPAQFAFLVGSVLIATLYTRKQGLVPGLAPNVYNLGIILGALILPAFFGMGIEGMAWGALVGAMIGNLLLPVLAMARLGGHFRISFDIHSPGVDRFFKLLIPVILGFSLPSVVNMITQKFASPYGLGVNTMLSLANNLMQAPLGIFGQALGIAAFPILTEMVAKGRMDLYRSELSKTLRTVLYLGIPSGALMLALAPQIVHALYGYGKAAQSPKDLANTADCLRIYALAIFAWSMQPVMMRGFFSLHKTLKPIAIGTAMTVVFIGLCLLAAKLSPDFRMLPAATDVAAIGLAVALYFALEADVGRLDRGGIIATLLLCTLASAVAGGACYGLFQFVHPHSKLLELAELLVVALVGAWIYFAATSLMKVPETQYVARAVGKARDRLKRVTGQRQ